MGHWLTFSLMTVCAWGLYGIFLHSGQVAMNDVTHGRNKAFLFVGVAYFLIAVLAPLIILKIQGATWTFPSQGVWWSLIAGVVGAVGAFCVLLAFGAGGKPSYVMSIIFAGAPIVNAVLGLLMHPPAGGVSVIKPQFFVGIILAAIGGCLVTFYKPPPPKKVVAVQQEDIKAEVDR